MSKARTLADFISDGSEFADGTISVAEVSGAAPLASPTFTGSVTVPNLTTTGNVTFGDNDKALFGADGDLEIYHDGGNSRIWDKGNGNLIISASNFQVNDGTNGEIFIRAIDDSSVELRHSNNIKLVTASDGVDITGDVGADTATITGTVTAGQYDSTEALPDVRPSLLLDFANSKTLDPRITFTRGSTATYWDGKTTTKAEENLQGGSTLFNTTYWLFGQSTFTANDATAPDGTSTAVRVAEDGTSNYHYFHGNTGNTITTANGVTYTWSIYAKKGSGTSAPDIVQLCFRGNTHASAYANFNISTGTVTGSGNIDSSSITSVGNGWYRLVVTTTANTAGSGGGGVFSFTNNNPTQIRLPIYTGDTNADVLLWGPQFEQRDAATAYTPTTTSPIVKYQPVLQTAASGEARFDHDPVTGESKGLLIEEARTNLATDSSYSGAGVTNITKIDNSRLAPTGYIATEFKPTTTSGIHRSYYSVTLPNTNTVTYSIYAKSNGVDYFALNDLDQAQRGAGFDLTGDGNVTNGSSGTGRIEKLNNGWFRCSVTFTPANTATTFNIEYRTFIGFSYESVAFNGFDGLFLTGFQVEQGAFPTSYIPTSGSTVTRSVDVAAINDVSWYNKSGGTIFGQYTPADTGSWRTVFRIGASNDNNVLLLRVNSGNAKELQAYAFGSKVVDIEASSSAYTAGAEMKASAAFQDNDFVTTWDGVQLGTDTSANVPYDVTKAEIGGTLSGANNINGTVKKVAYWPQRLSNATLQAMTEA